MNEYRIEKLRRPLLVTMRDGQRLSGEVFLRQLSRYRSRPEEPVDLLNDPEPFFALAIDDGDARLVAKENVLRAEASHEGAVEQEEELVSLGVPVEVMQVDGSTTSGSIFLESRSDRPRLLDFLNAWRGRFLPVVDASRVILINTQTIAHVREVA